MKTTVKALFLFFLKSTNNNNYNDKNTAHKQPKANDVVAADYDDNGDNSTATLYLTLSRRCSWAELCWDELMLVLLQIAGVR